MLTKGLQQTTPRFIQQSGPLRYKTQRNTALEILAENHWIRMDKKDNQAMIERKSSGYNCMGLTRTIEGFRINFTTLHNQNFMSRFIPTL